MPSESFQKTHAKQAWSTRRRASAALTEPRIGLGPGSGRSVSVVTDSQPRWTDRRTLNMQSGERGGAGKPKGPREQRTTTTNWLKGGGAQEPPEEAPQEGRLLPDRLV